MASLARVNDAYDWAMIPTPILPHLINSERSQPLPLAHPLPHDFSLPQAFDRLQSVPGVLWLDSVTHPSARLGRYSFLTADPLVTLSNPTWQQLNALVARLPDSVNPSLPPFQGGIAGVIGYEANGLFESIPQPKYQDLPVPAISVGLYDWTIAVDHAIGQSWLISQGLASNEVADKTASRHELAAKRIDQVLQWLDAPVWPTPSARSAITPNSNAIELAPQYPTRRHPQLTSNFSSAGFQKAVAEIVRSILRGDSFQVNLAQRLLFPARCAAPELYRRLRRENPAPEAAYYDGGTFQVLSSSPETFLRVRDGIVETRPIKGTCRRSGDPEIDAQLARELAGSEKDRAENIMIVDLMRNDLSRVCTDDSIEVKQLCEVEPYAYVQHLVSVVTGKLRPECNVLDLLEASFPGGSITGAPKIEAMCKIVELEQVPRGPYCGSIGYIGCGGNADFNILIRTITQAHGYLQIPVGGGITAASDPEAEERETWHKAEGLLRAIPI